MGELASAGLEKDGRKIPPPFTPMRSEGVSPCTSFYRTRLLQVSLPKNDARGWGVGPAAIALQLPASPTAPSLRH